MKNQDIKKVSIVLLLLLVITVAVLKKCSDTIPSIDDFTLSKNIENKIDSLNFAISIANEDLELLGKENDSLRAFIETQNKRITEITSEKNRLKYETELLNINNTSLLNVDTIQHLRAKYKTRERVGNNLTIRQSTTN